MDQLDTDNTPYIHNPEETKSPFSKSLNGAPSPGSAAKFVERSLHDLDDLIQKRRLELSVLRKTNRKKLTDQFATPLSSGSAVRRNIDLGGITLTADMQTPKLNLSQDLNEPPLNIDDNKVLDTAMVRITKEEYDRLISKQIPIGSSDKNTETEADIDNIKINKSEYEQLLNYKSSFENLQKESKIQSKSIEESLKTNRNLEEENQTILSKYRNVTTAKEEIETELLKMQETFNLINNDYEELKIEYQKLKEDPSYISDSKVLDENHIHDMSQISTDHIQKFIALEHDYQELKDRYDIIEDEKNKLMNENEELLKNCDDWENNSKIAAQSAFEWESHSTAVTTHFESIIAEWQTANEQLVEENNQLQQLLGEYEQKMIELEKENEDLLNNDNNNDNNMNNNKIIVSNTTSATSTMTTATVTMDSATVTMATATVVNGEPIQTKYDNQQYIAKVSAFFQLCNMNLSKREERVCKQRAFEVFKFNMYFIEARDMYKRKCAEYLKSKYENMKAEFEGGNHSGNCPPTPGLTPQNSIGWNPRIFSPSHAPFKKNNGGDYNNKDNIISDAIIHDEMKILNRSANEVRSKFNESYEQQLLVNRITEENNNKLNQSVMMSCFLLFFWLVLIYIFHFILTHVPGRITQGESLFDLLIPDYMNTHVKYTPPPTAGHSQTHSMSDTAKTNTDTFTMLTDMTVSSVQQLVEDTNIQQITSEITGLAAGIIYNDYTVNAGNPTNIGNNEL